MRRANIEVDDKLKNELEKWTKKTWDICGKKVHIETETYYKLYDCNYNGVPDGVIKNFVRKENGEFDLEIIKFDNGGTLRTKGWGKER